MKSYKDVDTYIQYASHVHQDVLREVRQLILKKFPKVEESISYGMPAYTWKGKPLCYIGAMKGHLGFYPTSGPIQALQKELQDFSTSKGCIRIPWSQKIPKQILIKVLQEKLKELKKV